MDQAEKNTEDSVMSYVRAGLRAGLLGLALCLPMGLPGGWPVGPAYAADYPTPVQGDWVAHDFKFHTGETIPELRIHYTTVGAPTGMPVLVLHGTGGSGTGLLTPTFAEALFGPGQALDATRYYVILPDAIGAGKSTRPSEGMHAKFPHYDYADMVLAEYRMLTEGLHVRHLRLVIGNSMGGMKSWVWGETYPGFMDALAPMASQPTAMAARNWMMRRMLVESIRRDPAYMDGNYTTQPPSLHMASVMYSIGTSGGTLAWQAKAPTTAKTNALVDEMLAKKTTADANDFVYQWDASYDYDPEPALGRVTAHVLVINAADDERNPPQTGATVQALKKVRHAQLYLIPASAETFGHGTTGHAHFWADLLAHFLKEVPVGRESGAHG
jgi:homoserine O-acetyltransferase